MYTKKNDRSYWISVLTRIIDPVLVNLSQGKLKECMSFEGEESRKGYAYLEAFGRTMVGIASWLECEGTEDEEARLKSHYASMARAAIDAATDPSSPDFMEFDRIGQTLVDAAFLSHAIIRAPKELWEKLDARVKRNLISALKASRKTMPVFSNWLLFSGMVEAALFMMGEEYDKMRVDYCIRQHEQWYKGDGVYGDGPDFHWDYYNSFVIQPMLIDILRTLGDQENAWKEIREKVNIRASRYAAVLERMISPEGTFPVIGRSMAYRFGAMQMLSQAALLHMLPEDVSPAQVRCALTKVIQRIMEMPDNFDEMGWLKIGFCGHQPHMGESYINTGSLYLCTTVFLPLGLSSQDEFWKGTPQGWTQKKIWSGKDVKKDQAIK